jgi:hypothetical protein
VVHSLVDDQWGKPVYDSSHLKQLHAYLRSQEHIIRIESADLAAEWPQSKDISWISYGSVWWRWKLLVRGSVDTPYIGQSLNIHFGA